AREALRASGRHLGQKIAERTAVAGRQAQGLRRLAAELGETEQGEGGGVSGVPAHHRRAGLGGAPGRPRRAALAPLPAGGARAAGAEPDDAVDGTSALIGQAIGALRDLSVQLSPPILHDRGLTGALEWLARDMKEKHGLEVSVLVSGCEALDEAPRLFAFEAL